MPHSVEQVGGDLGAQGVAWGRGLTPPPRAAHPGPARVPAGIDECPSIEDSTYPTAVMVSGVPITPGTGTLGQSPGAPRRAPCEPHVGFPEQFHFPHVGCPRAVLPGPGGRELVALAAVGPCHAVPRSGAGVGACALPGGQLRFLGPAGGYWTGTRCSSPTGALFRDVSFWLARAALPLAPGPQWSQQHNSSLCQHPRPQPAWLQLPGGSCVSVPGGKSPSSPLARWPAWQWPLCPSIHGAGAGNGIPKAAVPAVPSCPGVSLPAPPPRPTGPPPTPLPHTMPGAGHNLCGARAAQHEKGSAEMGDGQCLASWLSLACGDGGSAAVSCPRLLKIAAGFLRTDRRVECAEWQPLLLATAGMRPPALRQHKSQDAA
ncbi:uncharacterized protein [Heliangelus exortis]|uniref:uncharacterized protein n=1 Tax=Heliangelus exortis TaxID=472823 RepID=UPI003A8D93D2